MNTLKTAAVLGAATFLGEIIYDRGIYEVNIILLYILGVVLTAMWTEGRFYSLANSLVSVAAFNFFFISPKFSLKVDEPGYWLTFLIMFFVAFLISTLTDRVKTQAREATERAYRTEILLETSRKLQQARGEQEIIAETAGQMRKLLGRSIIFYGPEEEGKWIPRVFPQEQQDMGPYLGKGEQEAARRVYEENPQAEAWYGCGKNRQAGDKKELSEAGCLYMAAGGRERAYGVAGIVMNGEDLQEFEQSILVAMLRECAQALEKQLLDREKQEVEMNVRQERLRANLLRTISHDLRTPLAGISGNASVLMHNGDFMEARQRRKIYEDIYEDAMWLINLVENLLSVTRLENGNMQLRMQTELMEDVVNEAVHHMDRKKKGHKIEVYQEDDILLVKVDARLIVQVFINMIDNALKYTQEDSCIRIKIFKEDGFVKTEISDNGNGVEDKDKERLFDMFYTANNQKGDSRRGLGLGLALCKAIILAHGGEIGVRDNTPRGSIFYFTLPAQEVVIHE